MVPSRAKELFWVRELLYTVSPVGTNCIYPGEILFGTRNKLFCVQWIRREEK